MGDLKCVWEIPAILGEGPLWVERENALYWVDVVGKQVHRLSLADGGKKSWNFDTEVTSLAPRKQGGFIGTVRHGFAFFDFSSDVVKPQLIVSFETDIPGNRFNDGKADVHGRFWAGTVDEANWRDETGTLYRMDRDLKIKEADAPYICSNGPAFSVDNKTFYHTETMKGTVYAFDFSPGGEISNKRAFVKLKDGEGGPDGILGEGPGLAGEGDDGLIRALALHQVGLEGVEVLDSSLDAAGDHHRAGLPADLVERIRDAIGELSDEYVSSVGDVCRVGDIMRVKVIAVDDQDRVKLSRKAAMRELAENGN